MVVIDGNVSGLQQRHHPKNIPHPVNLDQRLSAKDKIVSKYCKLSKSPERDSIHPSSYHGGGMNLRVRPRVSI